MPPARRPILILVFDILVTIGLLVLAIQTVTGQRIFRSLVMFIVFGLVMALAWARLHAPDLAMAEAAIGAGITGALLLVTFKRLAGQPDSPAAQAAPRQSRLALPVAVLTAILVAAIGWAALEITPGDVTAGAMAREAMPDTGLGNPVTGVLLIFRGYDTLLEVVVLLLAFLGARAVLNPDRARLPVAVPAEQPLVGALLSLIVPFTVVTSVYLLQTGGHAPGGAFQGGAVLAAGGVLLVLTGRLAPARDAGLVLRLILVIGAIVFSAVGLFMLARGEAMLAMPGTWAVYLIETALMLSIALPLILLFAGASGLKRGPS